MTAPLRFVDRKTVARSLPPLLEQVELAERVYRSLARGEVEMPPKIGVHPREDAFLHAMPAYLRELDVVAMKWVAGYPDNPARGLAAISGVIVLNDAETGVPLAVLDAAEITAARTAAASGACVQAFAPEHRRRSRLRRAGPLPLRGTACARARVRDPGL